jgi:glycosyltransferase involved in cell wall biosynthesis
MVCPGDPDQFADAILELIPSNSSASIIGAMARQRVKEFDYPVVANLMMKVYRTILLGFQQ